MSIHIPIMPDEVLLSLHIQPSDRVMDCTFGGGGHSRLMAQGLDVKQGGKILCVDMDIQAINAGRKSFSDIVDSGLSVEFLQASFADVASNQIAIDFAPTKILIDLGWSMDQFADTSRGFSFQYDGALDMRLSQDSDTQSVYELLQNINESDLIDILQSFGEETRARKIAPAILRAVARGQMNTTFELAQVVESVAHRTGPTHPATKTFQALRMAVNHELAAILSGIPTLIDILSIGGRMSVITFHSIEDRLVKQQFNDARTAGIVERINKHVIIPSDTELRNNTRSRSAKLRSIIKL
jgi:16S rRNA (cytosine1402-N4)-methyltransferase